MNDLLTGKISLDAISLIIFDEAHRAVGDYPYVFLADRYSSVDRGRILGLTASPGSSEADLREICQNLHLEWVEARTISSEDVRPYVGGIEVKWIMIDLPKIFHDVKLDLEDFLREKLRTIRDQGYLESAAMDRVRLRDVLAARQRILEDASGKREVKPYLAYVYASIHAIRAIEFLETQGFQRSNRILKVSRKEATKGSPQA